MKPSDSRRTFSAAVSTWLPIHLAAARQGDCAGQLHRPARKKRRCSAAWSRVARLVEQAPIDADDAVAADHPIAGRRLPRAPSPPRARCAISPAIRKLGFDAASSTSGGTASMLDPGGVEHLAPDGAGGSENQGQSNNLVEKRLRDLARTWGRAQPRDHPTARHSRSRIHPRGRNSIPRL